MAADKNGKAAVIAYDLRSNRTTGALFPLTPEQQRRYAEAKGQIKGRQDLQANIDSKEAADVRRALAALKPEEARPFLEELTMFSNYSHGTHVAGIVLAGNPYVRLAVGRITFEHKMIPEVCRSTREAVEHYAAANQGYVDFFRANGARVVNMSWGGDSVNAVEHDLEACGIGKSTAERKEMAREWFGIVKAALEKALRSAPEILFVVSAGNSNTDAAFQEEIPASVVLPNVLTVGAVDRAGDETSFTSYGPTVAAHANGYEVESFLPGGDRMRWSGTSMAAPNVTNLAAKMLAVNPKLQAAQVRQIIIDTAERTPDGRRNLIHPKKALAAAMQLM
jgi:subtilisin family serine protease